MARSSVGLDIGTKAVRIAEVRYGGGRPTLTRFGRALLPAGAVEHGEVQQPELVASTVAGLWKQLGLKGRTVHVGVANRRCVVRVIELPAMSREDLEDAIRYQAQEHIPIPLADAVLDFEILEEIEGPEGQKLQRVLVVAAERATIDPLLRALSAARLDAQTLELNAYPLVRCFAANGNGNGNGNGSQSGAHAIVDVGAGVTNVVVHHEGKIRFTRILPNFGGDEFTAAIVTALDVSEEEAEKLKRKASAILRKRAKVVSPEWRPASSQEESAANVIEPLLDRFVTEVRGSIDFFLAQHDAPQLDEIVLTGGGSLLGGLPERLSAALGVSVEQGHAFAHVPVGEAEVSEKQLSIAEPFLSVAVGLALAENGG
jgi:type IV pilus assembly protein PilM